MIFEPEDGVEIDNPVFEVWINEEMELHKKLVHHMALAMASERWGVAIMGAQTRDRDVIGMCKAYELRKMKSS